ncbi:hypothetical protein ACTXT7_002853 [Hymenolepis weldensis]
MDLADLTYEKTIIFRFGSLKENQFGCFVFIPGLLSPNHAKIQFRRLFLLDKEPNVKKSLRGEPTPYPTIIRRMSEAVTPKMPILRRMSLSSRLPFRGHELNVIQFPDENETYQASALKPKNAENLVRGCNLCLQVSEITHPFIHFQRSKSGSPSTQLTILDPLKARSSDLREKYRSLEDNFLGFFCIAFRVWTHSTEHVRQRNSRQYAQLGFALYVQTFPVVLQQH